MSAADSHETSSLIGPKDMSPHAYLWILPSDLIQ